MLSTPRNLREHYLFQKLQYLEKEMIHFEMLLEYELEQNVKIHIHDLLVQSFPEYPQERIYYKLLPQFRYLAWMGEELIAHMGVEHRVITHDGKPAQIFGIIDLCVSEPYRSQKVATKLLHQIESLGRNHSIDFLVLFADDDRLYKANGYQRVENMCRWVMIDKHHTIGIAERSLADCMMVKPLAGQTWENGPVDMLGYVF
jgi:GNAT superfamily N-acetyltransferase